MINDNIEQEPSEEVNYSNSANNFGEVLKQAREAAGLSVGDVADKLIVSSDIIDAIDNSQAEALPALTFTQGYIRSYARIVDLPADEIIDAYNSIVPEAKKMTTPQSVLLVHQTSSDALVKVITVGFVVAGLVALVMWVVQTDFSKQFIAPDTGSDIKQNIQAPKPQLELRSEQLEEPSQQEPRDILIEQNTNNIEMPETGPDVNIDVPADQQTVLTETAEKVPAPQAAPVEETVEAVVAKLETTQVTGSDELMLTADGDSWCEIQDANGHRLFYQLLAKGDETNVKGLAPFRVFLGNAPDVRVEVNKKIVSFDHLINRNSKIANLNIEADANVIRFTNR